MPATRLLLLAATLTSMSAAGCVNVDPNTGETIPRGGQRYRYEVVTRNAERLRKGQTKYQVLMLLGSPAERSKDNDVWIYLPERPAVLIPGSALRRQFLDGVLEEWAYHPISLGTRL